MSPTSLKSSFLVYVQWRLQVSTSCKLHTGPQFASKLDVMSKVVYVGTHLKLKSQR